MPTTKPLNILWIQTDEQRTDSLGCYYPRAKTPNIDALAERGTVFLNHHTQSPVCVPSRVCELTSRYPHQTGILNNSVHYNWGDWPENTISFPEIFSLGGYATANFGKYHTPHHPTWLENWHFEWIPDEASFIKLADRFVAEEHELIHRGHHPQSVILSGRYPYVHNGRTPQSHLTDHALEWLSMYSHIRHPFLLRVSFLAPHTPVLAPEPFYSLYDPADMDWDVPDERILNSRPQYEIGKRGPRAFYAHSDKEFRRMRSTYYGLVSHIDQQVGRIIHYLDEIEQLDDTVIVYASDHGDLMGEYGQFQKGMFYDITTRVPCIFAGPGVPKGQRISRLTECVDIAPTLLDFVHLTVPDSMVGRNMFEGAVREDVIGEIALRRDGQLHRRSWIRTQHWSMDFTSEVNDQPTTSLTDKDGKLVNLLQDPMEHANLYYDPEYASVVDLLEKQFYKRTECQRVPVQIGRNPNSRGD